MKVRGLKPMLYNRLHREEIYTRAEFWDTKVQAFSGDAATMWHNNHLNRLYDHELVGAFERFLANVRGKEVIDLGCGTGRVSRRLAGQGARVLGVDFSAKAVDIARKLSPGENPAYRVQSMLDLDEVSAFDIAVSWGSVVFACRNREDLRHFMGRLYQALKPGGSVLLLEPIHKGFLHRVLNLSRSEFFKVMETTGFHINNTMDLHFWPTRLMLAYVGWPEFITNPCYHLGQWVMKTFFRNRAFGDYTCICATTAGATVSS